ncbi:MAG: GNAT family N-acetyltransferase [Oscillospiraceae bacterium]|nr:GNAT family N-acetyltransferase [Oscillospiraceae bacterium]
MEVSLITDPAQKEAITLTVMHKLPLWFSPPEDIDRKAKIHRDYPFFAVLDGTEPAAFAAVKIHNPYTADIYNIGVLEPYQHRGLGHQLVQAILDWCRQEGFVFLTVKTLDESANYPPYDSTRAFYLREGFLPLELFPTFWDADNPCLFLARTVK